MKRTPLHTLAAVACSGLLAFSLAACGSSGKDGSSSALSEKDFKKQANALCKTGNSDIKAIEDKFQNVTTEDDATKVIGELTDRVDKLVGDIKDLKAPSSIKSGVDEMLADVDKVVSDMKSQGIAYFSSLNNDPFTDADAKAREIGLDECAGDGS